MKSSASYIGRAIRRSSAFASSSSSNQPLLRQPILRPLPSQTQHASSSSSQQQNQHHRNLSYTPRRLDEPSSTAPPNVTTRETIHPQSHYEVFPSTLGASAIPPQGPFTLNLGALKKEFLQLQNRAHPDRVPQEQKRLAEGASARINEAYKTLQNPLLRAQYLLSLRGIDVAEDETAKVDDAELLMEVLETREVIEDADSEEDLVPLKEANEKRVEGSVGVLEEAFAKDDLETAKMEAVKLRYWINIRESIDAWEKGKPVVLAH